MSSIAQVLGQTLFAIVGGVGRLDVGAADPRVLSDMNLDHSVGQRARFRHLRMGEPGASNAARLGVNGR